MGPKLLVSDVSTASQPVLRWQLRIKGNTAVEFGVIPAALEVCCVLVWLWLLQLGAAAGL